MSTKKYNQYLVITGCFTVVPKIFGRSHLFIALAWKETKSKNLICRFNFFSCSSEFIFLVPLLCLQPIHHSIQYPIYPRNIYLPCSFQLTFPLFCPLPAMFISSVFSMQTHCRKYHHYKQPLICSSNSLLGYHLQ